MLREALRVSGLLTGLALALGIAVGPIAASPEPSAPPVVTEFGDVGLANCGPGSVPETGLQGQIPLALRQSGFKGFSCNLQLLSQYAGQGATYVGHWYGDCFYMPTRWGLKAINPGVAVVDVSDPTNIKYVASLSTPGMLYPHEDLRVTSNGLLVAMQTPRPGDARLSGRWFDVYDVSKDCAHPVLKASVDLGPLASGHEGAVSPDGKTYYDSTTQSQEHNLGFLAIDISQPNQPKVIATFYVPTTDGEGTPGGVHIHGLGISADGKLGYLIIINSAPNNNTNGLMIVDLSQIQDRKPNPQVKVISVLPWRNNTVGQMAQEFRMGGRTYIVATDEIGAGSCADPQDPAKPGSAFGGCLYSTRATVCDGYDPFAFARIIDVTDPRVPTEISHLRLQVSNPKNCSQVIHDPDPASSFRYDAHYCGVDNPQNTTAIACGYFESGIRVFDVRDPYHPKEIAYYNPPANPANDAQAQVGSFDGDPTADWASSWSRFHQRPNGGWELWIQTQENGVQILKFTNGVYPLTPVPVPAAAAGTAFGPLALLALIVALLLVVAVISLRRPNTPA